jgi:hypothetical protein
VWKVKEGVETTNMPPWKWVLSDTEIYQVILYEQSFSTPEDYNAKWAPQYSDSFGRNLMKETTTSSIAPSVAGTSIIVGIMVWNLQHRKRLKILEKTKLKKLKKASKLRRRFWWM